MSKAGPGKPPQRSRFRKGQSGNPKGRPRKPAADAGGSAFGVIVDKTLTISRNGVAQDVTVEEALWHKTYQQAIAGNRAARREVLRMIAKREQALARRAKPETWRVEMISEENPDNANEALLLLGIARADPQDFGPNDTYDRLKLEPWAVQAALMRRRGGTKLTEHQIAEIRRCTWTPEQIRWPRGTEG